MITRITEIPKMARRWQDGHKGDFGRVLVVGGSRGMIGAPALSANAALRCGAGRVRLALPESIYLCVAMLAPCATFHPIKEDENGMISSKCLNSLFNLIEENDVVALGPGLGQSDQLQDIISKIVTDSPKLLIIDADGLNNLAYAPYRNLNLTGKTILTPHPGEMKRLWQKWFDEPLPQEREEQAVKLSRRCGAAIVLKGAGTIVTDGTSIYVNDTGNPGMAVGGTGDVLTGCIAGLLARQDEPLSPLHGAILGVYIHGIAGDLAAESLTETSMVASDMIDALPDAWQEYESEMYDLLDGLDDFYTASD